MENTGNITKTKADLTSISTGEYSGNIISVNLSENELQYIDVLTIVRGDFKQLKELYMSSNKIAGPFDIGIFSKFEHLTNIYFRDNQITELINSKIVQISPIEKITFEKNMLTHIDMRIFEKFTKLQELWLSDNQIYRLDNPMAIRHLTSIKILFIIKNRWICNDLDDLIWIAEKTGLSSSSWGNESSASCKSGYTVKEHVCCYQMDDSFYFLKGTEKDFNETLQKYIESQKSSNLMVYGLCLVLLVVIIVCLIYQSCLCCNRKNEAIKLEMNHSKVSQKIPNVEAQDDPGNAHDNEPFYAEIDQDSNQESREKHVKGAGRGFYFGIGNKPNVGQTQVQSEGVYSEIEMESNPRRLEERQNEEDVYAAVNKK